MKTGRLFEIVYLLMEHKTMTTAQLARELEVSTRTVRRDIEALSGTGVPVYMTRGCGGGVHLLEGYVLEKSLVSDAEQDAILAALSALGRTGAVDDDAARDRLARIFRREPADWLDIDFSFWNAPSHYRQAFELIRNAICTRRLLRFSYYDAAGATTQRTVEPMRLVFKESCWYLRAWCLLRGDWRVFKLLRIDGECLEVLFQHFEPRPMPEALDEQGAYPHGTSHLELLFAASLAERVREEFAPDAIGFRDDGAALVTLECTLDERTRHYLLSFGSGLEVLKPAEMRTWLRDEARRVAACYAP